MRKLYKGCARSAHGAGLLVGVRGYVLASLGVAVALGIRQLLDPIWRDRFPYVILFVAVYAVIQLTSIGPSLFSILVGFFLSEWLFVAPRHSLAIIGETNRLNSVVFFCFSFGVLYFRTRTRQLLAREREAKEELSRITSRLNQAQEIAKMGSFVQDLAKDEMSLSPQLELILGLTPGHPKSSAAWKDLVHPEDREAVEAAWQSALERDAPFELDYRIIRPSDGQTRWLRCLAKLEPGHAGRGVHLSGVKIDITERKRLEERSRQAQRMEAIGHLAGGMAHEFNNILAAMMMNLCLVQSSPDPVAKGKLLQDVEVSCRRAADLIRQLLAFSRQSFMEPRSLDLAALISTQLQRLRQSVPEQVEVRFDLPNAPLWVKVDPALIERVVLNLCLNARDAMAKGGSLRLALAQEDVGVERAQAFPGARAGQFARLSVCDTGCGMDERTMKRLFEPFFTTKEVGRGTGLGLATVRGIVEQHRGWVEVESSVGRGSTFKVYLPVSGEAVPSAFEAFRDASAANAGTILQAEEEGAIRRR